MPSLSVSKPHLGLLPVEDGPVSQDPSPLGWLLQGSYRASGIRRFCQPKLVLDPLTITSSTAVWWGIVGWNIEVKPVMSGTLE